MLEGFGRISYQIDADNFSILLELESELVAPALKEETEPEHWTALGFHQCENCQAADTGYCPVARNLHHHIDSFADLASFDMTDVEVTLDDKITVQARIPAQQLLASLIGIVVAKSKACPSTAILQPMVLFHRPFAAQEESIYRSIANGALIHSLKKQPDEDLTQFLIRQYTGLHQVNISMVKRLQECHPDWEAVINALVNLDLFVKEILYNCKAGFPDLDYLSDLPT